MSDPYTLKTARNRLLNGLSPREVNLIWPHLSAVSFTRHQRLEAANRPVENVYFIETGLITIVATARNGETRSNVALVGFEGMTGLCAVHGSTECAMDTIAASDGEALQIRTEILRDLLEHNSRLSKRLTLYALALKTQMMFDALARAEGTIEQRLSVALLMVHDRLLSDDMNLTHDTLADILGVRRPAVTIALKQLETQGLVATRRGNVVVLDRAGTVRHASNYYGLAEKEYERLLK